MGLKRRTNISVVLLPVLLALLAGSAAVELATQPVPAQTRVAIVGATPVASLAQAMLSSGPEIRLVERDEIRRSLGEQELALSLGGDTTEGALRAGKILSADVVAVVETSGQNGPAGALVVFDAATGMRLWDAAIAQPGAEQQAGEISDAVQTSLAKRLALVSGQAGGGGRSLCVLSVRNADLPRGMDGLCQAVGQLVERELIASPEIAVLERSRLDQVSRERRLGGERSAAAGGLLPSLIVAEIEVSRNKAAGLRATVTLTGSKANPMGKTSAEVDDPDAGRLSSTLAKGVLKALGASCPPDVEASTRPAAGGPPIAAMKRRAEAARFYREARFRWGHNEQAEALRAAEAAHALEPINVGYHAAVARGRMQLAAHTVYKGTHPEAQQYYLLHATTDEQIDQSLDIAFGAQESMIDAAEKTASDGSRMPADLAAASQAMQTYAAAFGPLVVDGKPIARSDQLPPALQDKFHRFVAGIPAARAAVDALRRGVEATGASEPGMLSRARPDGLPENAGNLPAPPAAAATSPSAVPWSRARLLVDTFDETESFHFLCQPVVFEGGLHAITFVGNDSLPGQIVARAMRIGLSDGSRTFLAEAPDTTRINPQPRVPFTPVEKLRHFPSFGNFACIGDGYYVICDYTDGLFLFPLDGGPVRRITAADGLPGNVFSAISILDGKLYFGMGSEGSDGYLMSYDLKTGATETLATSRRKELRSPFDDGPPMFIPCMVSDAGRHRIVFLAHGADMEPRRQGFYQFTPADGKFRQLLEVPLRRRVGNHTDTAGNVVARVSPLQGDRVVFDIMNRPAVFDLATDRLSALASSGTSLSPAGSPAGSPDGMKSSFADSWDKLERDPVPGGPRHPAHPPFVPVGDWLWFGFGRVTGGGSVREEFPRLRPEIANGPWPAFMQYLPDRRQMVVCDGYGAWLLDEVKP